jgi:hypothetical protein
MTEPQGYDLPMRLRHRSRAMAAFSGDATDDVGIVRVEFNVDGALTYSDMAAAGPYYLGGAPNRWDTTKLGRMGNPVARLLTRARGDPRSVHVGRRLNRSSPSA